MKKLIYTFLFCLITTFAFADRVYWYNATSLTGGGTSSLDSINGQNLVNNDKAIVVTSSGQTFIYNLDSDSGLSEDSTNYSVVSPDSSAGTKRWILMFKGGRVALPDDTIDQGDNSIVGTIAWHIADGGANNKTIEIMHDLSVSTTIDLTSNTHIFSRNFSTITVSNGLDGDLFTISGDNVVIEGLTADGNKANNSAGSFIHVTSGGSIDNIRVENNVVTDFKEYGVHIEETCTNHKYLNNKFDGVDKTAILINPGTNDTSDNIIIEGNHVISAGVNGIQVYNDTNINNSNIFIRGNYLINVVAVPIEIQRGYRAVVSGNIIEGSGTNGISVGSCKYTTITGNVIEDQSNYGIELADIYEGGNITVTGNSIYNCGTGIIIVEAGGQTSAKVIIANNIIDTTTSQEGIDSQHVKEIIISGNLIKDPNTVGIRVHGVDDAIETITDVMVSNNIIRFTAASTSGPQGLSVASINGGTISNNQIISEISGSSEWDAMIGVGKGCKDLYIVDNQLIGTVALTHRGITLAYSNTGGHIYILRNRIRYLKVGIFTSSDTSPYVTISGNIIENSSSVDITPHASHKTDQQAVSPTQGAQWYVGDVVWETAPASAAAPGWVCVDRVETELRVGASNTDTIMEVDSTAGMTTGDIVGVEQDDGTWKWTTLTVTDGDTLELAAGLTDAAAIDNDVITNLWKAMAVLQ